MRARRPLPFFLFVALLLVGAVSGYWFWWTAQIEAGVGHWGEARRAEGFRVDHGAPLVDGFPLAHRVRIAAPQLTSPDGWAWQGPELEAAADLWAPRRIALSFPGSHSLTAPAGAAFEAATLTATPATGNLRIALDGRLEEAALRLGQARLVAAPLGEITAGRLAIEIWPDYVDHWASGFRFRARVEDVTLPPDLAQPLDAAARHLFLEGRLVGLLPQAPPRLALAHWRNQGGRLELSRIEMDWPPLALTASGTLGLDDALRPEGTISAEVAGLPELIGRLSAAGRLPSQQAVMAQAALAAFAGAPDAEGRKRITLPITLRGGFLYLGPLQLAPLAPLL